MTRLLIFLFIYFLSSPVSALEPTSGILCKNLKQKYQVEFLFKKDKNITFAKAFKRMNGDFKQVGMVVGKKLSSFILFEDKTIFNNKNVDFAWHLDEVTKNLKPLLLSNIGAKNIKMPEELSCISKNFWY